MAYVLGYFAADGSMLRNKRGGHFIEFTTTDRCMLIMLKRVCQAKQRISIRPWRNEKWKQQYRLQIGSKEWFADLTCLGFTQTKSCTLNFPKVPANVAGHFVRGYFDGDGCAYLRRHYSKWHKRPVWVFTTRFTSGSIQFLKALHDLLKERGIRGGYLTQKARGWELVFSRHDSVALYKLMYNTTAVSVPCLPRKRRIIEKGIQVLKLRW